MKLKKTFVTLAASAMSLSMMTAPFFSNGNTILPFTGITASAANVGTVTLGGIKYTLYDSINNKGKVKYNMASIDGCEVESGCVTIPEGIYYNGSYYKTYRINSNAFYNSNISAIDMHNASSLSYIVKDAFSGCKNLTEVLLPPNLDANLDFRNMFSSCKSLKSVAAPNLNIAAGENDENIIKYGKIFLTIVDGLKKNDITFNGEPIYTKDETNRSAPEINPYLKPYLYANFFKYEAISNAYANDYAAYVVNSIIDDDDSDFDKAVKLHYWLCDHAEYDPVIQDLIDNEKDISGDYKNHCDASAFLHYEKAHGLYDKDGFYTVCDGYARAYKLLMNAAGVSCERVSGDPAEGKKYGHAWNIIRLNDKDDDPSNDRYYYVDTTWDSKGRYDNFMNFVQGDNEKHSSDYIDWELDSKDAFAALPEAANHIEKFGDADKNGYLSVDDYKMIKEIIADGRYVDEADINFDGQVNNDDADIMAKYIYFKRGDVKVNGIIDEDDVNFLKATLLRNAKADLGFDVNLDGKLDFADVEMLETMIGAETQIIPNVESCLLKDMAYHTSPEFNIGDIDGSGNINNADIMILKGIIAADAEGRGDIYTEEEHSRADIDHDGKVTSADSDIMYGYLSRAVSGDDISFCQFVIESIMDQ